MSSKPVRTIVGIWLAWAAILIGFQTVADARFEPKRPDHVLSWTETETGRTSQDDQPYLVEPFMNAQVSWDSEFYLSIAAVGYDDPLVRTAPPSWRPEVKHEPVSLNYAFFPFYPYLMRAVAFPLRLAGMAPIRAATLAGVLISLLGTLGAMLALYDLTREELEEAGGIRAAFYLIIFPSGFFLAQVYTEGLFLGLAFGSLALLRRGRWVWAALLAACATWTRAVGGALIIPLLLAWAQEADWRKFSFRPFPWRLLGKGLLALAPLGAYVLWRALLGEEFRFVEETFFSRGVFLFERSFREWMGALSALGEGNSQTSVYYGIEFGAMLLALVAIMLTAQRYPGLALFGLAVFIISLASGVAQGMHRYVLAAPSIFILLSRWGRSEAFDRAWTGASVLLMGLLATLFTFDMWVG